MSSQPLVEDFFQPKRCVLLIEDEQELREIYSDLLRSEGWETRFELSFDKMKEAIQEVAGVILDWYSHPDLDRQSMLTVLSQRPLIVVSGDPNCDYPGFIQKPFDQKAFVKIINKLFECDRLFIGDRVSSKVTPDYGVGEIEAILINERYHVRFYPKNKKNTNSANASALRDGDTSILVVCHHSVLIRESNS